MRSNISKCIIKGGNSSLFNEFVSSLRYSTHCLYYIKDISKYFDLNEFIYFNEVPDESFDSGECSFSIDVTDDKLLMSRVTQHEYSDVSRFYKYHDLDEEYYYKLKEISSSLSFIVLVDFNCQIKLIGVVGIDIVHDHNDHFFSSLFAILSTKIIARDEVLSKKDSILRMSIDILDERYSISCDVTDKLSPVELKKLRAVGINVPLVLIQNLCGRNVKTYKFINDVCFYSDGDISYNAPFSTVFFDLDETLIWEGKPIKEIVEFMRKLCEKNYEVNLLTRHENDINKTLEGIGICPSIFKKIIKVEKKQLKSEFIDGESIFIDNEFPQRYDVNFTANIPSFDLDQVEFIKLK